MNQQHESATAALDDATIKQLSFKAQACRDIAVYIVSTMLKDRIRWSDDFDFSFVAEHDKNAIGLTWRRLRTLGILKRMNQTRPSKSKSAKGRTVWRYWLVNEKLAEAFLARNGRATPKPKQPELFGGINP